MNKIEKYAESVRKRPYFWPSTVNYLILIGFVSCNFYVLFNRDSPAIYLRVYHAVSPRTLQSLSSIVFRRSPC